MLLARGEEDASGLANEGALGPVTAEAVEEGLELGRQDSEAGGDAKENAVGLSDLLTAGIKDGQVNGGGVELGQN